MSWLSRTLPVSAVLHGAAGLGLFLVTALSPGALPEANAPPVTVPPVFVTAEAPVAPPPSGGGGRRPSAAESLPPVDRPLPPEPALPSEPDVGLIFPGPTDGNGAAPEGPPTGEPHSGGPGGDGERASSGPRRPGGDLQPPAKRRHVTPDYPELARRAGVEGVVVLECVIDPWGHVAEVKVLRGHPLLEAAAVDAVRQWVYSPTRLNGVPVAVLLTVTVHFRLPR